MTTYTNQTKNTTSYTNETKTATTFTNGSITSGILIWSASVYPWLLSSPWEISGWTNQSIT